MASTSVTHTLWLSRYVESLSKSAMSFSALSRFFPDLMMVSAWSITFRCAVMLMARLAKNKAKNNLFILMVTL